jgi:hypothetical protein
LNVKQKFTGKAGLFGPGFKEVYKKGSSYVVTYSITEMKYRCKKNPL